MYYADTMERCIWRCAYSIGQGPVGRRQLFCSLHDQPGWPDGSVIDAEDCLWNAQWGGGRVVRYTSEGKVDRVVELPTANTTAVAFGETDFRTLFITTARYGMSEDALSRDTQAGNLFAVRVDSCGMPESLFAA